MLKKLEVVLNSINQVLEDAEERQYKSPNVMNWLDQLKEAMYEAELLLDEVANETLRQKLEAKFQPATSKVRGFFKAFVNPFDIEIASRVEELLENIQFLASQKDMLGLRKGIFAGNEVGVSWKQSQQLPTTSLVDESSICGKEEEKEEIIKILLSNNVTCNQPATSKVRGFFKAFVNPFDIEIASRVEELLENIQFLASQKDMLGLRKGIFAGNEVGVSWKQSQQLPTTSLVDESSICGKEEEKEEIIKILLSNNVTCNQTLLLLWCYHLAEPPLDLPKLVNLRHLDMCMSGINKMPNHIGRLKHLRTLTSFSIGKHDVKELGNLNNLQGTLSIFRLENVTDPADAVEANLKGKKHLDGLVLNWGDNFGRCNENKDSILERQVLEALQPNGNLKKLYVLRYNGTSFPRWFGASHLPNLVSIALTESKFCFVLPPFGQLPSLKELSISCFNGIEVIGPEFCGNDSSNIPFRSLEILKFEEMSAWKEWCSFEGHSEEGQGLSCLKELFVRRCPWLRRALPQHLPSLQKLEICDCQHLEDSVPKAASIHEIKLHLCEKLFLKDLPSSLKKATMHGTCIIESTLHQILVNNPFLKEMKIHNFHGPNKKWSSLDLHIHDSLVTLSITSWYSSSLPFALYLFSNLHSVLFHDCPHLESFPEGDLRSSLRKLEIEHCPKLVASREKWGLFKLHSLTELRISDDFENVESFPEDMLLPPTLSVLYLIACSKLKNTNHRGFLHLKSLNSSYILCCPLLQSLLEAALSNSLSVLYIHECPLLKQRYQRDGKHWHKIHNIPSVIMS
ncbi:disease resistance protein RPM1 [Vigna unguiculata]|uniref:Disease resistance protein RPM1 n=1 Tax=Vigna unguiculata TaxID=3917 RepID=A0A4D6M4I7_VIGUN|nr:disease resistance protein RPM1 [Vigna unguiculata]